MSGRIPAEVFPPGEFIREELEARAWTQTDLAEILGRPLKAISEILTGKRAITPETAHGLGEAFGTGPQLWMNLESTYRLSLARKEGGDVARRAKLYESAPVKDMIKRQWIDQPENTDDLERELTRFFGPKADTRAAARMSAEYVETWTSSQLAWLCRAQHLARSLSVGRFDEKYLDQALAGLPQLTSSEQEARRVPRMLADVGIRFLVIEHLPKTRIDGAALWLDGQLPVVVVSLRYDRIDGFWHTLAHELAHIKYRDGQEDKGWQLDENLIGEGASRKEDKTECERRADEFACNFIVPREEIDSFVARVRPYYSKQQIIRFANRIRVHPGLIVGQLQHRGEIKYSQCREMLVKIRDKVTESALTDGWGSLPQSV